MKSCQGQLVCQHLENIFRKALENYQKIIKDFVKGRHGVYALYKKGRLYYVGLASNLRKLESLGSDLTIDILSFTQKCRDICRAGSQKREEGQVFILAFCLYETAFALYLIFCYNFLE